MLWGKNMYFFYIDDSGNRDTSLQLTRPDGSVYIKDHIYVLTAVGLYEGAWRPVEEELTDYKLGLRNTLLRTAHLPTEIIDCEVKSSWLRHAKEREKRSPFLHHLSDDQRTRLAEMYYSQLSKHRMHLISVIIDKRHLHADTSSHNLHLKAYEILLERIERLLMECYPKHKGLIVMDDSERELNRAVAMKHAELLHHGGQRFFSKFGKQRIRFNHIAEYPFFTESSLSHGVQLADLCAYNVYRAFKGEDFTYPFFERVIPHFYNSKNTPPDKIDGLKIFPDTSPLIGFASKAYAEYLQKKKPAS